MATLQHDFDDFKRFMWDEDINLKPQVKDVNDCGDKNYLSWQEKLFEKLQNDLKNMGKNLVILLENRLLSLEKQLSKKQSIIESLLNKITITTTNDQLTITENKKVITPSTSIKSKNKVTGEKIDRSKENQKLVSKNTDVKIKEKLSIHIVGDSILTNIEPIGLGKNHIIKVKSFNGSTSEDIS